jgi:hypothetical protein
MQHYYLNNLTTRDSSERLNYITENIVFGELLNFLRLYRLLNLIKLIVEFVNVNLILAELS